MKEAHQIVSNCMGGRCMLGWECYYEYVTGRANFLYICTRTQQFNVILILLKV